MKPAARHLISSAPSLRRNAARDGTLLALGLFATPLAQVQGTTFTWAGATNGQWGTAANWGGTLPSFNGTEDIIIPTSPATNSMTLGATRDVKTVSIQNDGGVFS